MSICIFEFPRFLAFSEPDEVLKIFNLHNRYDMTSVAKLLIEKGANLQAENRYGTTALHFAARRGNLKVCQMLLDNAGLDSTDGEQTFRKANPDVTDNAGV